MTAFDTTWDSIVKIDEAQDPDDFLDSLIEQGRFREYFALREIGRIFQQPHGGSYTNAILQQLLDPSNQYSLTDAKTPTVYRAEPIGDAEKYGVAPDEFRYGRYFSPQRFTAEQYAQYQSGDSTGFGGGRGDSQVHEYEMPVGFDDDSVLNVPTVDFGSGLQGTKFEADSPEVNRVATMNDMTIPEAQKALQEWHSVYMGSTPIPTKEGIEERVKPLRDAGYDYIIYPEFASGAYFPPTVSSAFGSIDWGAPHEAKYNRKEVDEWWKPTRKLMMEQLGIPHRFENAMGKHRSFPQWASWHIGDEESAPRYVSNQGIPNTAYKYQTVDYPNFSNAADIAEDALGLRGKRWDAR